MADLRNDVEAGVVERVHAGGEELVALVSELIACDTTARDPGDQPRDEAKFQAILGARLRGIGADVDVWEPETTAAGHPMVPAGLDFAGRPQLAAVLQGSGGGPSLLLNGHIDAVPAGDAGAWASDPFKAEVRDGLLYGRGANDMKGGIASLLFALECLSREGVKLRGDVVVCTNSEEESTGAGGYVAVWHGVKADAGICAEPTGFEAWTACRGLWMMGIAIDGVAGHAEMPAPHWLEGGSVNAIEKLPIVLDAVARLREDWRRRPDHRHPLLSPGDVVPTVVRGGEFIATYPSCCELLFDATYLPAHVDPDGTSRTVEQEIRRFVDAAAAADPWLARHPLRWRDISRAFPAEMPGDHPLVTTTLSVSEAVGRTGKVAGLDSWHDAATFTLNGTPTFSFGPRGAETAHAVDEYVPVDDLADLACVVALAAMRYCGT